MRCMSCREEMDPQATKIWHRIVVCSNCLALAEKAEADVMREINRAKQMAENWLEQHILRGGLLAGGDGEGTGTGSGPRRDVLVPDLPWLRREEATDGAGGPDAGRPATEQQLGTEGGVYPVSEVEADHPEHGPKEQAGEEGPGLQGDA